ncbi:2-aminoethylphosphonate--pyruvate transaminase [Nitrincola alkalilacustris]|uniref:2-aminoethylphosphonate--pyruvate transaminase n=1 Tax=Nitrincola alkalilacustris TaxID=1571224 RepID=UPI00124F1792|nr:2-aminoethylphosphonate--pyruvate transaminase [Nitrincola alkalilacustris]
MKQVPYLLTPGPLTTSESVKAAMQQDWGSWDEDFNRLTTGICERLLQVAGVAEGEGEPYACVPIQGSGTFAVEAVLDTLLTSDSKTLVLINGAYGQRLARILARRGLAHVVIDKGDYAPPLPDEVEAALIADSGITHVALIHCETSSGILNPLEAIAAVVSSLGRLLIVDSMSAFGALPVNLRELNLAALISSANKCFEGVPGFGFALIRQDLLEQAAGNALSLSLDLHDQWQYMQRAGQWRFTPPTHVVAAFVQALQEHEQEGGVAGRLARYSRNRDRLVAGMQAMGFSTLLEPQWLSPIIVTFLSPQQPAFEFMRFYDEVKQRGFLLYPGKLTEVDSFRIGCIGQLFDEQIDAVLLAIGEACEVMGVKMNGVVTKPSEANHV